MSSTIKFQCLDNSGNNIFLVDSESGVYSTNTTESTNSSTGAVLLYGGLSINSTANAIGLTRGGALTIAGGASVAKNLYVGLGITTSTLLATNVVTTSISSGALSATNVTGSNLNATNSTIKNITSDIVTTGSLYVNTITANNTSSGNLYVNNSTITNLTSSYISTGSITATTFTGGDLRLSGNIVIGGTLTTVNITTTNVVDTNISTTNLAVTNINNTTMTSGTILVSNLLSVSNANITNTNVTNITAANISTTNANVTNITASNSNVTNITASNSNVTNITASNANVTNITASNSNVTNANVTNITASNANVTNANITNANVTNITASNSNVTNITASNISTTNANITNVTTSNLLATNNISASGLYVEKSTISNLMVNALSAGNLNLSGDISNYIITTTFGNVGINTTNPGYKLDVNGDANIATGLRVGDDLHVERDLYVQGSINGAAASSSTFAYMTLTATDESINLSTGALVTFGGITIQCTTDSTDLNNGGSLITPGGVSIGKRLLVGIGITTSKLLVTDSVSSGSLNATNITATNAVFTNTSAGTINSGGITTGNINFTGTLYQNGVAYLASQWSGSIGSTLSYTSGNVIVNNLQTTNTTLGALNASNVTTSTLLATTSISSGSLSATNTTITNAVHTTLSSGSLNVTNAITSALTTGSLNVTNVISTNSSVGTINSGGLTTGNINFTGTLYQNGVEYVGSQWTGSIGSVLSYTSGNVVASNVSFTNATISNLRLVNTTMNYTNVTMSNLIADNVNLGMSSMFSGSFIASNNVVSPTAVTSLIFPSDLIRSFRISVSVSILVSSGSNLYALYNILGNRNDSGWSLFIDDLGDISGITFSINSSGQILYTSSNISNFVSSTFRYSAEQFTASGSYASLSSVTQGTYLLDTIQINNTTDTLSGVSNGGLYVLGGATVTKGLRVSGDISTGTINSSGITTGNINFTGTLYQNGIAYVGSQWSGSIGSAVTYTSGNVIVNNLQSTSSITTSTLLATNVVTTSISSGSLNATNMTATNVVFTNTSTGTINSGGITTGNINFTGTLYQNGVAYVGSQWTGSVGSALTYTSGNVGIGIGSPGTTLDVLGQINVTNNSYGSPTASVLGGDGTRVVLSSGSVSTTPVAIGIENNNMWFSNKDGGYKWYSNTSASMQLTDGNMIVTGDITSFGSISDRRLKTNIETINDLDALNIVTSLRSVTFDWKDDIANVNKRGSSDVGFIAQEVEELIPYAVSEFVDINSGVSYKNMKHERIIPYLVSAIRHLEKRIRDIESKNS